MPDAAPPRRMMQGARGGVSIHPLNLSTSPHSN
jgi:hypothetical protein